MSESSTPWPAGHGEMAGRIRGFDWASTPLGPIAGWPSSLRVVVDLMLDSPTMMSLLWGPEAIHLYNDGFTVLLREQPAAALGRPALETFARSRDVFAADLAAGMAGRSARLVAQRYPVLRNGRLEDAWFDVDYVPIRDEAGQAAGVLWTLKEITTQVVAERALREGEERQAFLLRLTDAMRALSAPVEIMAAVSERVGTQFQAGRCGYAEIPPPSDRLVVARDWTDGVMASLQGSWPLSSLGDDLVRQDGTGRTVVIEDAFADASSRSREGLDDAGRVTSSIAVQLVKHGEWVASFYVQDTVPRAWTPAEVALMEEIAERTWSAVERARTEAALRESEERFRQFAKASAAGLWIRQADTLAMEFVSPAVAEIYGLAPEDLLGDVRRWAAMIVPEDRDIALGHLEAARRGEAVAHEFRIQRPSDHAFRWIRNTDFPLRDNGHIPRVGGIAEDITETRRLVEHQGVLLAELQHRVRNIMGMIRSMANRTAGGAGTIEDYRALLEGRLLALARIQALLTRAANAGGSLRGIIESEVAATAHSHRQFVLRGPDVVLAPKAVEVLTLAFHELATNALKYGALSAPEGRLTVSWAVVEQRGPPWLSLDWTEEGLSPPAPPPSPRRGFGSELIEARIPYELGGIGRMSITPAGARCHLEFPLNDGSSILETDAPKATTVFGGALDMSGAPDLTGRRVLVVEDDYYMAYDTAAALRSAGATVIGPCPSEDAARDACAQAAPTHAVLDLNLGGGGPRFAIAQQLRAQGVPFVFLTGYDPEMIPDDLRDVARLQKPVPFRAIVEAVSRL